MTPGVFAKTFPGTGPAEILARAAAAGFGAVQYNLVCSGLPAMPDAIPRGVPSAAAGAAARAGVRIAALSGTFNMIHPDQQTRERGLSALEQVAKAAVGMRAPLVTLCTGTRDGDDQWRGHPDNATPEAWRDLRASMARAVEIAERHGVMLGIEPEPANVIHDPVAAERLLAEMRSDRLGIVIDPANLFATGGPDIAAARVAEAIDRLGPHIVLAHAKDRAADGRVVPAGRGVVDFADYTRRLARAGYDGAVVAHGIEAADAPAVARLLARHIRAAAA